MVQLGAMKKNLNWKGALSLALGISSGWEELPVERGTWKGGLALLNLTFGDKVMCGGGGNKNLALSAFIS